MEISLISLFLDSTMEDNVFDNCKDLLDSLEIFEKKNEFYFSKKSNNYDVSSFSDY